MRQGEGTHGARTGHAAGARSSAPPPRYLEAERLASTRRHDDKDVAPLDGSVADRELVLPERAVAAASRVQRSRAGMGVDS
eukprot:3725629-Prymnesium_polylepis.1